MVEAGASVVNPQSSEFPDLSSSDPATLIRKQDDLFSNIPAYKSEVLNLQVDADDFPKPSDEVVDLNVEQFHGLLRCANMHLALTGWSARLVPWARSREQADPQLTPAGLARESFKEVFYSGMVAGVSDSLALTTAAFLATSSTKQALRLARIVGLGSERALEREVIVQLSNMVEGVPDPRAEPSPQLAGIRTGTRTASGGGQSRKYHPDKIPLEVRAPWDGPTTEMPYVALRKNVETTGRFYKLSQDELLVFLFRNLSPALRSSISSSIEGDISLDDVWQVMDQRYCCAETCATATARWEGLGMNESDTIDAYASRVRLEAQLFGKVTGSVLTPSLIVARLIRGLLPAIRESLEASLSYRLSSLTFEEAREAAMYVESKNALSATEPRRGTGGSARGKLASRNERQDNPLANPTPTPSRPGPGPSDRTPGRAPAGLHCRYCAQRQLPGHDKHNDDRCWQNPANAAIVPAWYKERRARGGQSQAPGTTFMAAGQGAMWVRAECRGRPLGLLLDTGSDYSIVSSETVAALQVGRVRPLTSPVSVGSVKGEDSVLLRSTVQVPICVADVHGKGHSFSLLLHVAESDSLHVVLRRGVVLLGAATLARLAGDILYSRYVLRCHALQADFPLTGGPGPKGVDAGMSLVMKGGPPIEVPSDDQIRRRLANWSWPTVEIRMSSTANPPPRRGPYPCGLVERKAMTLLVRKLEVAGHVQQLTEKQVREGNYWIVPAFVVPKDSAPPITDPDQLTEGNVQKQYRLVLDHRPVNECCEPLPSTWAGYQVPINEGIGAVGLGSWFASVDVKDAYFMLRYASEASRFFGFSYWGPDGTVRYGVHLSMVMGWCNASFWWSWAFWLLLDTALHEVVKFLIVYVDDVLVWHPDRATCARILEAVLCAVRVAGGEVPPHKVKGPAAELDFVGLHLTPHGYTVSEAAMAEVRTVLAHPPTTLRGLRVKLGIAQYCRNLWSPAIAGASGSLSHLTAPFTSMIGRLTAAGAKKSTKLPWTSEHDVAWRRLAGGISGGLVGFHRSEHSSASTQFVVTSDASPVAGAASLYLVDREEFVVAFKDRDTVVDSAWLAEHGLVLALWMHKWTRAEQRYDISDRELYAVCKSLFAWRHRILECLYRAGGASRQGDGTESMPAGGIGRLVALTDSTAALGKILARNDYSVKPCTTRDKRWLSWLADLGDFPENGVTLCHVGGCHNQLSDVLSRLLNQGDMLLPEGTSKPVILTVPGEERDVTEGDRAGVPGFPEDDLQGVENYLVECQQADATTDIYGAPIAVWVEHFRSGKALPAGASTNLDMGLVRWKPGVAVFKEVAIGGPCWALVVPDAPMGGYVGVLSLNYEPHWTMRQFLLFVFHDVALHPGAEAVREALFSRFWWPGASGDVARWIQACDLCLETKRGGHLKSMPVVRVPRGLVAIAERGKHVSLDHGFPPTSWLAPSDPSHKAFLCVVCLSTGFCVLCPVTSTSTGVTMSILTRFWFPVFGLPLSITSDNAISTEDFRAGLDAYGVRACRIASYSPWANGAAERRVGLAKERMASLRLPWDDALPWAQLALNATPTASGSSPAMLMLGADLRTPSTLAADVLTTDPSVGGDDFRGLLDSTEAPAQVREVIQAVVGKARRLSLAKHTKDAVRRATRALGRLPVDGEKVVWRRPNCIPVEGTVRLVEGPRTDGSPFVYLNDMVGQVVVLEPESVEGNTRTVPVSAIHLEPRRRLVDRARPTLSSEGSMDPASLRVGDVVLCRLTDGADALAVVVGDGMVDSLVQVLEPMGSSGLVFKRVWVHVESGDFHFTDSCPAECVAVLRSVDKVLFKVALTARGKLREGSRRELVVAGYLPE